VESSSQVPAVARVVCEGSRTRVRSPVVRAHGDGVHFSIENVTGATLSFFPMGAGDPLGIHTEMASSGDNSVPPGIKEMRWFVPPGLVRVACIPSRKRLSDDQLRARETLIRVVDPFRVYVPVPSELDCQGGADRSYELILPLRSDDPEEPVRATRSSLVGLQPGDAVERAGYPQDRFPFVKIVRDGRVVAMVNNGPGIAEGLLWSCVESGIRRADPSPAPRRPRVPSPMPTERFPSQVELVEGKRYWVLYLAIARKGSPQLDDAIGRAHLYGYTPHVRTLGCDGGAPEAYRLPKEFVGVALYFGRERDPWFVADAINAPHHGAPIKVIVHCVD
jgi:hypothetical protein